MKEKRRNLKKLMAFIIMLIMFLTTLPIKFDANATETSVNSSIEIPNSDFELTGSGSNNIPNWSFYSDKVSVVSEIGINGTRSKVLKITNTDYRNTYVTQTIKLEPNTEYVLTGYVKGENIIGDQNRANPQNTDGAAIDLDEDSAYLVDQYNNWEKGTYDWTKVTVYFVTSSKGEAKIRCRLGHHWGASKGTAYFDNISIKKAAYPNAPTTRKTKVERKNIVTYLDKEIIDKVGSYSFGKWVDRLQVAYEAYRDLVGSTPYFGDKLRIINTYQPTIQEYGAIGNYNPLLMSRNQLDCIDKFTKNGDCGFGYLHEMGHAFDKRNDDSGNYGWNFDSEFWANTKMLYALDYSDDVCVYYEENGKSVKANSSNDMEHYYKSVSGYGYDAKMVREGTYNNDALTYLFIKIVQKIGWAPFKATFREFTNGDLKNTPPTTDLAKFEKFIYLLQKNYNENGSEVYDCFSSRDYKIICDKFRCSYDNTLDSYRIQYKEKLENYVDKKDYRYSEKKEIEKIIYEYSKEIENSGSWSEINVHLNNAQEQIDKVKKITTTTIYYNKYENPKIHYKIGSGSWTKAPGVDMESCENTLGKHKITIEMGTSTTLTACFNDGNNTWDNNGGRDYTFGVGYYIVDNGKITKIDAPEPKELKIESVEINNNNTLYQGKEASVKVNAVGGSEEYTYSVYAKPDPYTSESIINNSNSNTGKWTPKRATDYIIYVEVSDSAGNKASCSISKSVKEATKNQVTIYYKGYDNPNIHYQIGNGAWTKAPGVKMESNLDVEGYYYSITIDLGTEENLTACFNDGNGNWDSNNGKNYNFGTGYYTFSNRTITKIDKPSSELKINSITCSSGSTIKMGSTVDMKINASGGEGEYKYSLYYHLYGSGRIYYILKDSTENIASYTPDYPKTTTLYATVVDKAGNTVSYQQSFDVKEITTNQITIYYKGYNTPYIHYKIGNGTWTKAPGVEMIDKSEKPDYTHKITIDLGEENNLTACFNNGSGTWDNNNNNNYHFDSAGTYTFSNGNINKID